MPFNMVTPIECPSCGEYDRCYDGCACPACFPFAGPSLGEQFKAWRAFAPLMKALNDEEIAWQWSLDGAEGRWNFTLDEVPCDRQNGPAHCQISFNASGEGFIVEQWYIDVPQTYDHPAEWAVAHIWEGDSVSDCVDYLRTIGARS